MMLYGTLFMMAGAYTLAANGHVRGDILYGFFTPRTQAFFDLVLYIVFLSRRRRDGLGWLRVWGESFAIREHSSITADGPPIYPFKAVIPLAGALLLLQGAIEILRCIVCLRTGAWPKRVDDVEEVDVDKLRAMVSEHVAENKAHDAR